MAESKRTVAFPVQRPHTTEQFLVNTLQYEYDPGTREVSYNGRVIGYVDLAGNFQVEPEYEKFVRDNPIRSSDTEYQHIRSAKHKDGTPIGYYEPGSLLRIPSNVGKGVLETQHTSVMIGNKAGLLDEATNKVYDRISMKEIGDVDAKGVLQLNQTTSKYPEYAELRGKPVRKQIPPKEAVTNIQLELWPSGGGNKTQVKAYWDTETGEVREQKDGGVVYGRVKTTTRSGNRLSSILENERGSPYDVAQMRWVAGPYDDNPTYSGRGLVDEIDVISATDIRPKDPTVGKHRWQIDPATAVSGGTPLKPSPPASPDRKGSNAPSKRKSLLESDFKEE